MVRSAFSNVPALAVCKNESRFSRTYFRIPSKVNRKATKWPRKLRGFMVASHADRARVADRGGTFSIAVLNCGQPECAFVAFAFQLGWRFGGDHRGQNCLFETTRASVLLLRRSSRVERRP